MDAEKMQRLIDRIHGIGDEDVVDIYVYNWRGKGKIKASVNRKTEGVEIEFSSIHEFAREICKLYGDFKLQDAIREVVKGEKCE